MNRGQGTFEYVLLLGGVLLIVVLAIVVLQNTGQSGFNSADAKRCSAQLESDVSCVTLSGYDSMWNPCGQVNNLTYAACGAPPVTTPPGCPALLEGMKYCGADFRPK